MIVAKALFRDDRWKAWTTAFVWLIGHAVYWVVGIHAHPAWTGFYGLFWLFMYPLFWMTWVTEVWKFGEPK